MTKVIKSLSEKNIIRHIFQKKTTPSVITLSRL